MSADRIVTRFDYARLVKMATVPIITVYNSPDDYPGKYVARVWSAGTPTNLVAVADTYEELVKAIPSRQMMKMERDPKDEPCIVEVWL